MPKITRRAALARSTAIPAKAGELPELETAPPAIGGNQPPLPSLEQVDDMMRDVLQTIARNEAAIEHARQWLAYHIMRRQDVLLAADPNVPSLAAMMETGVEFLFTSTDEIRPDRPRTTDAARLIREARDAFTTTLLTELCGPYMLPKDRKTDADHDTQAHRARVSTRLKRAIDLAIALSWCGYTADAFDTDKGKWPTKPDDFVPPGYTPAMDLLMGKPDADGKRAVREIAWLENDPDDAGARYYVQQGATTVRIALSLDQFLHATERKYVAKLAEAAKVTLPPAAATAPAQAKADAEAKAEADKAAEAEAATPTPDTEADKATRAPHHNAPAATPAPTPADTNAKVTDDRLAQAGEEMAVSVSTSDTPEADTATAKARREHTLAVLNKSLPLADAALNMDYMAGLRRDEFSKAAQNLFTTVETLLTRWKAEELRALDEANKAKANGNGKRKAS